MAESCDRRRDAADAAACAQTGLQPNPPNLVLAVEAIPPKSAILFRQRCSA